MNPSTQMNPPPIANPSTYPSGYPPYIDYEGILVPIQPPTPAQTQQKQQQHIRQRTPTHVQSSRVSTDLAVLLRNLLPSNLIYFIVHWGTAIMNVISVIAFGGILTSAICALTPICTISFGSLPLSAAFERNLGIDIDANNQTDTSTTISRVRRATNLLQTALEKYEQLQQIAGKAKY